MCYTCPIHLGIQTFPTLILCNSEASPIYFLNSESSKSTPASSKLTIYSQMFAYTLSRYPDSQYIFHWCATTCLSLNWTAAGAAIAVFLIFWWSPSPCKWIINPSVVGGPHCSILAPLILQNNSLRVSGDPIPVTFQMIPLRQSLFSTRLIWCSLNTMWCSFLVYLIISCTLSFFFIFSMKLLWIIRQNYFSATSGLYLFTLWLSR